MTTRYVSIALLLFITQNMFANSINKKPTVCPSLSAIKSGGITSVEETRLFGWIGLNTSHYNTSEQWQFAVFDDQSANEAEAWIKLNHNLYLLNEVTEPQSAPGDENLWMCHYYNVNLGVFGTAVTPASYSIMRP